MATYIDPKTMNFSEVVSGLAKAGERNIRVDDKGRLYTNDTWKDRAWDWLKNSRQDRQDNREKALGTVRNLALALYGRTLLNDAANASYEQAWWVPPVATAHESEQENLTGLSMTASDLQRLKRVLDRQLSRRVSQLLEKVSDQLYKGNELGDMARRKSFSAKRELLDAAHQGEMLGLQPSHMKSIGLPEGERMVQAAQAHEQALKAASTAQATLANAQSRLRDAKYTYAQSKFAPATAAKVPGNEDHFKVQLDQAKAQEARALAEVQATSAQVSKTAADLETARRDYASLSPENPLERPLLDEHSKRISAQDLAIRLYGNDEQKASLNKLTPENRAEQTKALAFSLVDRIQAKYREHESEGSSSLSPEVQRTLLEAKVKLERTRLEGAVNAPETDEHIRSVVKALDEAQGHTDFKRVYKALGEVRQALREGKSTQYHLREHLHSPTPPTTSTATNVKLPSAPSPAAAGSSAPGNVASAGNASPSTATRSPLLAAMLDRVNNGQMYEDPEMTRLGEIYESIAATASGSGKVSFMAPTSEKEVRNLADILESARQKDQFSPRPYKLAIPVHTGSTQSGHWTGALVTIGPDHPTQPPSVRITFADSLGGNRALNTSVKTELEKFFKAALKTKVTYETKAAEYRQPDAVSCGACAMENLLHLAIGKRADAPPSGDMNALRQYQAHLIQTSASQAAAGTSSEELRTKLFDQLRDKDEDVADKFLTLVESLSDEECVSMLSELQTDPQLVLETIKTMADSL